MNSKEPIKPPLCMHCNKPSRPVRGSVIYPHRPDLAKLKMWACKGCGAYAGSNRKTGRPIARPANEKLRNAREHLQKIFNPIWLQAPSDPAYADSGKDEKAIITIQQSAKKRCYAYLAHFMGIEPEESQIGLFDYNQCREAYVIVKEMKFSQVRDWSKNQ